MRTRIVAWSVVLGLVVVSASCAQIFGVDVEYRLSGTGGAPAECGDGIVASGEACDDGNKADGDGCSSMCTVENGWSCAASPSVCGCAEGYVKGGGTCIPEPVVVEVVAGGWHACARLNNGSVKCWGRNDRGQLGQGDTLRRGNMANQMGHNLNMVDLGTDKMAKALAAGADHTCSLLNDGNLKCWGSNEYGQLGQGNTTNRGDMPKQMGDFLPVIDLGKDKLTGAIALATSFYHTCALLNNNSVKCWGANAAGQLGQGNTMNRGDMPNQMGSFLLEIDLGPGNTATALASIFDHTCVLLNEGSVKCWGANVFGQLGQGDTMFRGTMPNQMGDFLLPVNLGMGKKATALATGNSFTCVLLNDGSVKCWGANGFGQLGQGNITNLGDMMGQMGDNLPTVDLGTGKTATALAAGVGHVCALLSDGQIKCWGLNDYGQLGLERNTNIGDLATQMGDALPVVNLGTGKTATALAAGGYFTCALLNDSSVKCWGAGESGQLGQGDIGDRGETSGEMGDNLPPVKLW